MNISMLDLILFLLAALLVWETLLLIPMIPGKLIDTRDFSDLPKWQYNLFNIFLTSLGMVSFVISGFALSGANWVITPCLILGVLYALVFYADLFEIFPVVKDKLPIQLLILESIGLSSAGLIIVVSLKGLFL